MEGEVETFEKVEQLLNAFKVSRVLLTALQLGVFKALRKNGAPMQAEEVGRAVNVHQSMCLGPLLDVLVAEGLLLRLPHAAGNVVYDATPATARLLGSEGSETSVNFEFGLDAEWQDWSGLTGVLSTGKVLSSSSSHHGGCHGDSARTDGRAAVDEAAPEEESESLRDDWYEGYVEMEAFMRLSFLQLVERFDFTSKSAVVDVGGATAQLSRLLAERHQHLQCTSFDLPSVTAYAKRRMLESGVTASVADRVHIVAGDCLVDEYPQPCDVVVMANLLHEFSREKQQLAVQRAHDALSCGGTLIVIEQNFLEKARSSLMPLLAEVALQLFGGQPETAMMREDVLEEQCHTAGFLLGLEKVALCGNMLACVAHKPKKSRK